MTIVVTGGVATGKSTWINYLLAKAGKKFGLFDCDKAVHELLTEPAVVQKLECSLGVSLDGQNSLVDRSKLRNIIFSNDDKKSTVESILHPLVAERLETTRTNYLKHNSSGVFLSDIPLFFETNRRYAADLVVVVGVTPHTQVVRLRERNGFSESEALKIIGSQRPIREKVSQADLLIWNEGPVERLSDQTDFFMNVINACYE